MKNGKPKTHSLSFFLSFSSVPPPPPHTHTHTHTPQTQSQAVIFEVGDRDLIGHATAAGTRYCCTKELVSKTKCHQDRLIYQKKADGWPKVLDIYFENNDTKAYSWEEAITVEKSGMYYLWFVTCDDDLAAVTVDGATEWKNPTGYLPGAMIPLVRLSAAAAALYAVVGALWLAACARAGRGDVGSLQAALASVVALGAAEHAVWFADYSAFNASGRRPVATTGVALAAGVARRTLARYVALAVALGHGVMTPSLPAATRAKVACLCATYALASATAAGVASVGAVDDSVGLPGGVVGLGGVGGGGLGLGGGLGDALSSRAGAARLLLALPAALADAVFVLWIFSALSKTLAAAASRRATAKLDLYRKFTNALAVSVWAGVAWAGYEAYARVADSAGERWRSAWVLPGFWVALDLGVTCAVAALFRPCAAASRFAYSETDADEWEQAEKGNGGNGAPVGSIAIAAIGGNKSPLPRSSGEGVAAAEEVGKRE